MNFILCLRAINKRNGGRARVIMPSNDTCRRCSSFQLPPASNRRHWSVSHCSPTPPTMKFLSALTAALLPFTALAAKKPTGDRFQTYNSKQLSAGSSVRLDDKTYGELTKTPRDYSVAVLLTALEPRFGCGLCKDFQPEYDLLARSWSKGDKAGEGRLLFGTMDFLDGKATFQSV